MKPTAEQVKLARKIATLYEVRNWTKKWFVSEVAELLAAHDAELSEKHEIEIANLQQELFHTERAIAEVEERVRREALEEAATFIEENYRDAIYASALAKAIRALASSEKKTKELYFKR